MEDGGRMWKDLRLSPCHDYLVCIWYGEYFLGVVFSGNHYFVFAVLCAVAACVAFATFIAFVVSAACVGN